MTTLNSSSKLKVKRDTFFVPDSNGGVYFRNNMSSFRLEGKTIYQWIETLLPMFNGEQTLEDLTTGLTPPYKSRVYELSEMLVQNGFVRDLSQDQQHTLDRSILEKYACQIEFIENFTDSAAYRFQQYRQTKPLVIGSADLLISMVSSLIESGLSQCDVLAIDSEPASQKQLEILAQKAQCTNAEIKILEGVTHKGFGESLQEAIGPYDWVLYFQEEDSIERLIEMNHLCKQQRKAFIPAVCIGNIGLTGPVVLPEADGCFESAWRRLHQSALKKEKHTDHSALAASVLANVAVFEFFKTITGIAVPNLSNRIYLLDLETLEGEWLNFITHPLTSKKEISPILVEELDEIIDKQIKRNEPPPNILEYFSRITSKVTGIFHSWEERNLSQLPLSQCYVQAIDPLSAGPAELLPEVNCGGFTHQEALREAGLTGIEMYVSRWLVSGIKTGINRSQEFLGIGAGETVEEAVCRGLEAYLNERLRIRNSEKQSISYRLKIGRIEDRRCRFYFHALTTLNGFPSIGMEEELFGFPVIWLRTKGRKYTKAGLNITIALRSALKEALLDAQNEVKVTDSQRPEEAVFLKLNESKLEIPSCEELTHIELLRSSIQLIKHANNQLEVYDLSFEPFLKEELAGVFGVQLREGRG